MEPESIGRPRIAPLSAAQLEELRGLDRIVVRDLLLRCIVGINPEERVNKQDVVINVELFADLAAPGASDDIEQTVNYKTIKNDIVKAVEASSYFLVEKLAAEIAAIALSSPLVRAARVRLEKPGALRFARSVGVDILRTRRE